MASLVLLLLMAWHRPTTHLSTRLKSLMSRILTKRQGAEIVTVLAAIYLLSLLFVGKMRIIPNLAKMERILFFAMNVGTFMRCLTGRNGLNALQSLRNWSRKACRHTAHLNVIAKKKQTLSVLGDRNSATI